MFHLLKHRHILMNITGKDIHCIAKGIHSPIHVIEFRSSSHFHVHRCIKIKHLGMHTASTNNCERTGCSQEFQCDTVIGFQIRDESSCEIFQIQLLVVL